MVQSHKGCYPRIVGAWFCDLREFDVRSCRLLPWSRRCVTFFVQLRHFLLARLALVALKVTHIPRRIFAQALTSSVICSEMQLYTSLCVAALLGSSLGTWLRKFVVQEVPAVSALEQAPNSVSVLISLSFWYSLLFSSVALIAAIHRLFFTVFFG